MEKEIQKVGIDDFKDLTEAVIYKDEDIVVVNSLRTGNGAQELLRLDCFLIGVCMGGGLKVDIDYKTHRIMKDDVVFLLPNTIVGNPERVTDSKIRVTVFSTRFLRNVLKIRKEVWDTAASLRSNPVMHQGDLASSAASLDFSRLLTAILGDKPHCYSREVIRHIFAALVCELMGCLTKVFSVYEPDRTPQGISRQNYHVMQRFAEMLATDGGIHRSVKYYADTLCYTPKHFSKLIKDACGRTPMNIITDKTIDCIRYELQHSVKSIKEIADDFDFPNQSFFGKYVKKHTGMTPQELREAGEEA